MEFKIVIPPTGEEYKANDINSVRAYFILAYKKLIREGKMTNETIRCADVLIYTPDYCLGYCQYEGQEEKSESHYAHIGAMVWVTPEDSEEYMGLQPGAYWCDYADTGGEITYSRRVAVNGRVNYNMDYDVRFT